jgi:uncharacterized membrane protein YoaK (UPF0700 family)
MAKKISRRLSKRRRFRDSAPVPERMPNFVPLLLSFVAGFVDVITFVALFGLYVAQVTGSFVTVGARLVGFGTGTLLFILAIPIFLFAAMLSVLFCHWLILHRRSPLGWSLTVEALLVIALYLCIWASPLSDPDAPLTLAAGAVALAAMGMQSAFVRLLMRGAASTNVMTTNTSLLGISAAETLIAWKERRDFPKSRKAAHRFRKVSDGFRALSQVMLGFLGGAALGVVVYDATGANALLAPVGVLIALAIWAFDRAAHGAKT